MRYRGHEVPSSPDRGRPMSTRLSDYLLRWEEHHNQGQDLPAAELCPDAPELAPALQQAIDGLKCLGRMMARKASAGEAPAGPPKAPKDEPPGTLAVGVGEAADESPSAGPPGYVLLGELGRGGMG